MSIWPVHWKLRTLVVVLTFVLVSIFTLSTLLVYSTRKEVVWIQTTRIGTQEQVVARAGAKRIESFFRRVETDLHIMSQARAVGAYERSQTGTLLEVAVDRYAGTPLVSFVRITKEGEVVLSINRERIPMIENVDASDRSYFIWAKEQIDEKGVFLSEPIIARAGPLQGQKILVIAVPSYRGGVFDGVMFASIAFDQLVDEYVKSLAVYEGVQAMLLDREGNILSGLFAQDDVGHNAREIIASDYPDKQKIYEGYLSEILSGVNSWVEVDLDLTQEEKSGKWIIGFAPMSFGNSMWSVVVLVSHDEALGRFERYQQYSQLGLVFAGLGVVSIGLLSIVSMRKAQLVWYKRGFERAKKLKKDAIQAVGIDGGSDKLSGKNKGS
jgi:hypothetical protein